MPRLIYPVGAYALSGLTRREGDDSPQLLSLDTIQGYLLQIDPQTENSQIINSRQVEGFKSATGLSVWQDRLWLALGHKVLSGPLASLALETVISLPYEVDGVAVWQQTLYVTSQQANAIFVYDAERYQLITEFALPGIGVENITVFGEYLWLCDRTEQTVYCLDRATGEQLLSVLTPFASPTGIAVPPETTPEGGTVWLTYATEEPYVRDNPNTPEFPYQLTFRDRTFIHPLQFQKKETYALSTGYRIEMIYAEELEPLDELQIENLTWRMALPANTARQRVVSVEPVGLPFITEQVNGQNVAVFKFDQLAPNERHLFGWRALLEVRGLKHQITPYDVEDVASLSADFKQRYLVDDDELAMDKPTVREAARRAVGSETNLLRQVLSIRNYVYDRLSYGIRPAIDTPDVVLERGIGSCGEYVGLLLALCRLNGIACRTVGRYKCPPKADQIGVLLEPEFNHVWIEFYVPGVGWLPMESNVDDVQEGGPYPTRFFMGLPWYHIEMAKEVPFERLQPADDSLELKIGDLALNHVRFRILEELG
ncbi:MAG: transglutaminase family protein [Leptolyngbya sp. SIO4C1]|nr:transglutaminase family protein [Leptolyngbya sp. SIO4C1]